MSLSWSDDVPVKTVWLAFSDYPGAYLVRQLDGAGALIREDAGQSYVNHAVFVAEETRAVTVLSKGEISLCSLYAYGAGVVPGYHPWEPTPEKLDYLIVAMHPDDDVLFMGAILPLYTVEEGREGSVYYAATQDRVRKDEAGDGAWVMGLRTAPLLGAFPDIPPQYREQNEKYFTEAAVTQALVRLFRQYRPEVVFSHDLNGEYGHWQHKLLAGAVREAAKLAAKGYYDPQSVRRYETWQVKKTYLHLYRRNQITLPVDKPIAAYGGLTPREIAAAALQRHVSQLSQNHTKAEGEAYDLSAFGLVYTAVGPDTPGLNDPFEHIDPAVLHCNPAPTPTFTPAPLPCSRVSRWVCVISMMVWPSLGRERAYPSEAEPLPPVLLATTSSVFSAAGAWTIIMRAVMSVPPPTPAWVTTSIGLDGNASWAWTAPATRTARPKPSARHVF